jgi:hypothetical protein
MTDREFNEALKGVTNTHNAELLRSFDRELGDLAAVAAVAHQRLIYADGPLDCLRGERLRRAEAVRAAYAAAKSDLQARHEIIFGY